MHLKLYAKIEKKMLAIRFGCNKFYDNIYGMSKIKVETDHRSLSHFTKFLPDFKKMIIQKHPINLVYCPLVDTLSRAYIPKSTDNCTSFELG